MVTTEKITPETQAEIDGLIERSKQTEPTCCIYAARYAVGYVDGVAMVYDGKERKFKAIEITRCIRVYGSGMVTVDDTLTGIPCYDKDAIKKSGLVPITFEQLERYGKITKFYIDSGYDENDRINRREIIVA